MVPGRESGLLELIPARALGIYAHPDDPDISCGGTLARWAAGGCEVHLVVCTKGDKGSRLPSDDPALVAARRREEAERANKIIGTARLHHLDRPDGELENDLPLRRALVGIMRRVRPEVVVCPDPTAVFFGSHHFNHRDHRQVGWAALDSVSPACSSPLYFPEQGAPHEVSTVLLSGSLEPDTFVDVTAEIETKVRAVACHESQLTDASDWYAAAVKEGAEAAGRQVGRRYAEGFRRLELA